MLSRFALILQRHFCIDYSQFKKTKWAKLTDRSLLVMQGPDIHKLLQGLVTNDLRELGEQRRDGASFERIALFTLFLQPKGKILTDAFIFRPRIYKKGKPIYATEELWLDIDRSAKAVLKQHLKRHMWRKRASLIDIQEQAQGGHIPTIYSGYNEENETIDVMRGASVELQEFQKGEQDGSYANLIYFDPRGSKFGLRIVSSQEHIDIAGHFETIEQKQYNSIMQSLGMPPRHLFQNRLPFQFNFDFLNAISLRKGCYIGQEIISRGFLTGIIRKRVFPFVVEEQGGKNIGFDEANCSIKTESGQEIGKVMTLSQGNGLALINYLPLVDKEWPIMFTAPFRGRLLAPFGMKLKRYMEDMKDKQKTLEELEV